MMELVIFAATGLLVLAWTLAPLFGAAHIAEPACDDGSAACTGCGAVGQGSARYCSNCGRELREQASADG